MFSMNPITVLYKLKLKGYNLSKIAREVKTSRQNAWEALHGNPQRGKGKKVLDRIDEILNN